LSAAGDIEALGATLGEGEGCGCPDGSLALTLVKLLSLFAVEFSAEAKVLMPQRPKRLRTSTVLLEAFLIRD